jgi:hypothetical protein
MEVFVLERVVDLVVSLHVMEQVKEWIHIQVAAMIIFLEEVGLVL